MERRRALAAASAATLVLGSTIVASASVTGASFLGFGGARHGHASVAPADGTQPGVVVRTRNVYDRYVVDTGSAAADMGGSSGGSGASSNTVGLPSFTGTTVAGPGSDPATPTSTPTTTPRGNRRTPSRTPATAPDSPATTPTTATVTPTITPAGPPTTVATTPTTWPVGVPRDWPTNMPIPPMPANCQQPQLEDNGVWNCDH